MEGARGWNGMDRHAVCDNIRLVSIVGMITPHDLRASGAMAVVKADKSSCSYYSKFGTVFMDAQATDASVISAGAPVEIKL
jgi:hypothetical protein